jgi:hypothetical protein
MSPVIDFLYPLGGLVTRFLFIVDWTLVPSIWTSHASHWIDFASLFDRLAKRPLN